eukprot:CAMPEP_0117847342 /NCGR_PEP_ID=MMETSP0949-20121206/19657_1 /TAXON_ID=44440 /ORGANISM="Chattonella subsalsa, Strain CCMP2191" /LENGTH=119 /DNA_ID=CAMNT_0005693771 /DNA_START=108 /DNA_END=464 /DNA_ORIENTATION=-
MNLWHWGTAQRMVDFNDVRRMLGTSQLHIDYLIDCHYSTERDELSLLAGDQNGTGYCIRVTPTALEPVYQLTDGHKEVIRCFLWSDEDQLVTGGEDARICHWNLLDAASSEEVNSRAVK